MHCAECQNLLSDFLDGDISDRYRRTVGDHLESCGPCATLRDDLVRIIEASASLPLHTPSPRVWEAIQREIGSGANVVRGPQAWWDRLSARRFDFSVSARELVAAAAGIVVLAGAVWTVSIASPGALPAIGDGWGQMPGGSAPVAALPLSLSQSREEVARFRATVDDMARRVEQRKAGWSSELRETFAKTMAPIDARVAERERAYAADGTEATRAPLMDALREKLRTLDEFALVK
jgi:uncharacterized protein YukE